MLKKYCVEITFVKKVKEYITPTFWDTREDQYVEVDRYTYRRKQFSIKDKAKQFIKKYNGKGTCKLLRRISTYE